MAEALDERRILNVAIAERPNVPLVPTNSPVIFGFVGILLSLTVTLGVVFAVEYMDPSFRTPSEVATELNIPVLASVPHRKVTAGAYGGNGNGRNGAHRNGWEHEVAETVGDPSMRQS